MTSAEDIRRWFLAGAQGGRTHMIVVRDGFSYTCYPVYVSAGEDARHKADELPREDMIRVMEVYKLTDPMDEQLDLPRCFRF